MTNIFARQKIIIACAIGLLCLLFYFFNVSELSISYMHNHLQLFKRMIEMHYFVSVLLFVTLYFLATAMCIPGSSVFTIIGGMLFNQWPGFVYALTAATLGSSILFLFSRYLFGTKVQTKYAMQLRSFNQEMKLYGKYYLLGIRLVGLLPFGLVTLLASVTVLPLSQFILMTACGILPISFIYVYTGTQLAQVQSIDDIYSPAFMSAGVFFVIGKIVLLPLIIKLIHWRTKNHNRSLFD